MARSSETFFGPDNRCVVAGQDVADDDEIIAGREELFGQKRKRTRRSGNSSAAPARPAVVQPPTITKPIEGAALAPGAFFEVAGEAVDGGAIALYAGRDLDAVLLGTATASNGLYNVQVAMPANDQVLWATVTVDGDTSEASEYRTVHVGTVDPATVPADDGTDTDAPTVVDPTVPGDNSQTVVDPTVPGDNSQTVVDPTVPGDDSQTVVDPSGDAGGVKYAAGDKPAVDESGTTASVESI